MHRSAFGLLLACVLLAPAFAQFLEQQSVSVVFLQEGAAVC